MNIVNFFPLEFKGDEVRTNIKIKNPTNPVPTRMAMNVFLFLLK